MPQSGVPGGRSAQLFYAEQITSSTLVLAIYIRGLSAPWTPVRCPLDAHSFGVRARERI